MRSTSLLALLALPCLALADEPAARPATDLHGDPLPFGARARLGTARLRHGGPVAGAAFAVSGKFIASPSADRTVRLWDAATGKEIAQFRGHRGEVRCLALASDGKVLASGGIGWSWSNGNPAWPRSVSHNPLSANDLIIETSHR